MQGRKHKPEQIIRKLRTAEMRLALGERLSKVCPALEVSEATYHRWRRYGGPG